MAPHHDEHEQHRRHIGRFGPLRALLYFVKNPRGVGNRHVLSKAGIQPGEVVLDVGSGPGSAVIEAVKHHGAGHAIGVEPSSVLRTAGNLRAAVRGVGASTKFLEGTAESLPIPDDSVDVVIAVNSIHHWENLDEALAEINRVLRPGGRFAATDEDFAHADHPMGEDPHADWPDVDYDRMKSTLDDQGMTIEMFPDTADGVPVQSIIATRS